MRTVAIVQARMGSSRLPGKSLLTIQGRPTIWYLITALRQMPFIDDIMIAITRERIDDPLADYLRRQKVPLYRGDAHNLMRRYLGAARRMGLADEDAILRITGDDIFVDAEVVARSIRAYRRISSVDKYVLNMDGLPYGGGVGLFSYHALMKSNKEKLTAFEKEHVGQSFLRRRNEYEIKELKNSKNLEYIRLSIDYPEDIKFARALVRRFPKWETTGFSLSALSKLIDEQPDLLKINQRHNDKRRPLSDDQARRLHYAVVGNGSMGSRRLRHLQEFGCARITAFDIRPDRMSAARKKFGVQTVATVDRLVASRPDVIFICVPPAEHIHYLRLAARHGWHLMCENPVYHQLRGLDPLIKRIKKNGTVANISCNMRFQRSVQKIKQLIQAGVIGKVLTGWMEIGEWLPDWHPWEPYTDYYPSNRKMGGGLDAICDLDWLMDIFGEVELVGSVADKLSDLDIDTDDVVMMHLRFRKGPLLHLHADMLQRSYSHDAKFIGERGTILWRCDTRTVYVYTSEDRLWKQYREPRTKGKEWAEEMYVKDTRHFINCLQGRTTPLNTIESNREALKVVLEAIGEGRKSKGGRLPAA